MIKVYRLAILNSHPIQYFAPLYRRLAQESSIDLTVYYCSHQGANEYTDPGFGVNFKWDRPLLDSYHYKFLPNLRSTGRVEGWFSLVNPAIVSELLNNRYDALWIHGHNYATFLLAIIVAKIKGIPILMRCETHLLLTRSTIKRIVRQGVMSLFYQRLCTFCLPIGSRNRDFYRLHGVPDDRLFMVPYTVDNRFFIESTDRFRERALETRNDCGLPLDKPLILFASKLTARKRPMDLLQAYQRLRLQYIEACLVFVGSGEQQELLDTYVQEHQIPNVHFLGFRNQSELPQIYAMADMFVLPSENEPWGLIINEVMCAGLPVVAAAEIGAVPDLVKDSYNGFVFQTGDVEQLTRHLATLAINTDLREQMGRHSRMIINSWDYERCTEGILLALERLQHVRERRHVV